MPLPMRTMVLTLAYDGTDFVGWQRQARGRSVQGLLEEALGRLDGAPVEARGAGRTDAGVHALGQVASAVVRRDELSPSDLARALNGLLPADVRVVDVAEAPGRFDARFEARGKLYRYRIANTDVVPPFERRYVWAVRGRLDTAAMVRALRLCEGRHDFAAFQSTGSSVRHTVRTITRTGLAVDPLAPWSSGVHPDRRLITIEIAGDGFLRHMVRAIIGTCVEIGSGRRTPGGMAEVLAAADRSRAGPTAPAAGLFLVAVEYAAGAWQ